MVLTDNQARSLITGQEIEALPFRLIASLKYKPSLYHLKSPNVLIENSYKNLITPIPDDWYGRYSRCTAFNAFSLPSTISKLKFSNKSLTVTTGVDTYPCFSPL